MYDLKFENVYRIPFNKVLEYCGIKYEETDTYCKCTVNNEKCSIKKAVNLYWISNEDKGNTIMFVMKVHKITDYVKAAQELHDYFFETPGNEVELVNMESTKKENKISPSINLDNILNIQRKYIQVQTNEEVVVQRMKDGKVISEFMVCNYR